MGQRGTVGAGDFIFFNINHQYVLFYFIYLFKHHRIVQRLREYSSLAIGCHIQF